MSDLLSTVYAERSKCVQLLISMLLAQGCKGGIRKSSIDEDPKFPVLFAIVPFIDENGEEKTHEISWHTSIDDFVVPFETFGIVESEWDGKSNNVTYERLCELVKYFLANRKN